MDQEAIGATGRIAVDSGVPMSLLYLAVQVRQNTASDIGRARRSLPSA